ncbi:splicing factor, partial [Spiromyces aspiralis]
KDRRTVFVTQLAARLTNRELREFFEKAGKVHSARIVADRISRRSKGVGYVEFEDLESVPKAVGLTGEKLLGIPIIVQYSEAEKNRQSAVKEYNLSGSAPLLYAPASAAAFADLGGSGGDKLYISNIPAAITEEDIKSLFSTIGEIDSFRLFASAQPPQSTTSRCNDAIVQYKNPAVARRVLTELNGLDLLGTKLAIRHATEQECEAAGLSGQPAVEAVEEQRQQPLPSSPVAPVDAPSATLGNGGERSPVTAPTTAHTISTPTETITSTEQQQQQKQTEEATEESHSASNGTDAGAESPTTALMLSNMFDPEEETAAGEPNWVQELQEDVGNECEKYGHLLRVDIDPNSKVKRQF